MEIRAKTPFKFRLPEFLLIALTLASGVMLSFSSGSFVVDFKQAGFSALSAATKGAHAVAESVKNAVSAVTELATLREDYDALSRRLSDYEQLRRQNAEITRENERLKEQLGFIETVEQKSVPARIISRSVDRLYPALTIDKGVADGVERNMPVIAYQGGDMGLVGKIVEAGRFTSTVMPLYSVECTVSARIQSTRDIGLVSGLGSDSEILSLRYIRRRVAGELRERDVVVTSGENGNYMRDMPVGTILAVREITGDSSLDIDIEPIIDFQRLETVLVIDMRAGRENAEDGEIAAVGRAER